MKERSEKMAYNIAVIAGLKFASNMLKSEQEGQQYLTMAETELNNAEILKRNAFSVRAVGAMNEDIARSKNRAYIANNSAIAGEAGISESPTTMSALATSANALEQNVLNERFRIESEAENYLYQARIAESNAEQLKKKYYNSFGSSLLSSVAGIF